MVWFVNNQELKVAKIQLWALTVWLWCHEQGNTAVSTAVCCLTVRLMSWTGQHSCEHCCLLSDSVALMSWTKQHSCEHRCCLTVCLWCHEQSSTAVSTVVVWQCVFDVMNKAAQLWALLLSDSVSLMSWTKPACVEDQELTIFVLLFTGISKKWEIKCEASLWHKWCWTSTGSQRKYLQIFWISGPLWAPLN